MCHLVTQACPPRVTWQFSFYWKLSFLKTFVKFDNKMTRGILVDPLPLCHLVSGCHVLFEWSLTYIIYSLLPLHSYSWQLNPVLFFFSAHFLWEFLRIRKKIKIQQVLFQKFAVEALLMSSIEQSSYVMEMVLIKIDFKKILKTGWSNIQLSGTIWW